ncbi:MAG: hypothetical protein VKL39_02600 [Leptolyngbyaceae bacterium]|nr:hypothetical protein [Leptolyngbyaceae bacterium]
MKWLFLLVCLAGSGCLVQYVHSNEWKINKITYGNVMTPVPKDRIRPDFRGWYLDDSGVIYYHFDGADKLTVVDTFGRNIYVQTYNANDKGIAWKNPDSGGWDWSGFYTRKDGYLELSLFNRNDSIEVLKLYRMD